MMSLKQTLTQCALTLLVGTAAMLPLTANPTEPGNPVSKTDYCAQKLILLQSQINKFWSEKFPLSSFFKDTPERQQESWSTFTCAAGLLANAEFESGFTDWDFYANSAISTDAYFGTQSANTSGLAAGGVGQNRNAYPGQVFSLEVFAKKNTEALVQVGIKFFDATWNEVGASYLEVTSTAFDGYALSARAPDGTAYVQAMAWKNEGAGDATFDGFCFEEWNLSSPNCALENCELTPDWGNYLWSLDDSGTDANWLDYDDGGLTLCNNGDGTLSLTGNLINGHDADWSGPQATICGSQDGWYLDLNLSDRQDWATFGGSYVQSAGCSANHTDWDYWDVSGTLTGTGCNTGRTITITGPAGGYRMQIGWGGNSHSCDFGMSTWFTGTEGGATIQADIYAHLDANCYFDTYSEDCADGVDNDNDGLADCYDSDCAPQILQNQSFETTGGVTFTDSFQGSPARALPNSSTLLPGWEMDYGCGGSCEDSYWIDDSADLVNNPKGDYFLWLPGSSYCAGQSIAVDLDKCYEITMTVAAFSVPDPQLSTNVKLEAYGGGIDNGSGGILTLFEAELPASPNWQNPNWQTLTFTWSPPASATTNFYISQDNATTTARGILFDEILVKEICCAGNSAPEISCEDGRDVELNFAGIKNDIPKTLSISDLANIDSVVVEVVYKSGNPGSSITLQDDASNSYTATRQSVGSNAYVYRTVLPPTTSVTYSNTSSQNYAQSLSAFVFRNSQPGKTVVTEFTTIGGYNGTFSLPFNIPKSIAPRDISLSLPISEITLDDRSLDFVITAGTATQSLSRSWGPNGESVPNGCCIDTVNFFLPDVAPDVDLVTVDVISPGGGTGQSFVIAASIAVEISCEEVCGNGIDDDGDGYVDNEDQDCLCPEIYTEQNPNVSICEGENILFEVSSNAPNPPYSYIEFYRFDLPQANPYTSSDAKVWLGEFVNDNNGSGSISSSNFQGTGSGSTTKDYYVYACVKPEPQDPETCYPFAEYVITVSNAPTMTVSGDATICSGANTLLSATATGGDGTYTYTWDNSLGAGTSHTVSPTATTTYSVTVTSGNGCTDTDQVTVTVNPSPSVNAGADQSICPSDATTLTATGSGAIAPSTFQWSHGLGTGDTKVVSPSATTTYSVTLTSSNGCNDIDEVTVTVGSCFEICTNGADDDSDGLTDCDDPDCAPVPDAGPDLSICLGTSTLLVASVPDGVGAFSYTWSHGLGTGAAQMVTPTTTTTYTVTVSNTAGCTGTDTVQVTVNPCPEDCTDGVDNDGDGLVDCEDPDCEAVAAPLLADDAFNTCPGIPFSERVTYNDGNLQSPLFSIFSFPNEGTVSIDGTGKFTYTPLSTECTVDSFAYQVCNQATGCCAEATVVITIGDTDPPVLLSLPADITISCDEQVPDPGQVLAFDACPGIYVNFEEVTEQYSVGACETFAITRTWESLDLCGNSSSGSQVITIEDSEAPELFRVYTLKNGSRIAAGMSQRSTENWKYVSFPITFANAPVVLGQVISENGMSAVALQVRNVNTQGFEMRLQEQEASDGSHAMEQVTWLAIEPGVETNLLDVGTLANVGDTVQTLAFGQNYTGNPLFLAASQTVNEADPTSTRTQAATGFAIELFLQEETSKDTETAHAGESIGYLAVQEHSELTDEEGQHFGEAGSLNLTNAWATVSLNQRYTKPVIVVGGVSNHDPDPVTVRVRNITDDSFEVRLQEWDSQDGAHASETVSYLVVEGSLPEAAENYCVGSDVELEPGVNVFVRDNCDGQAVLDYSETATLQPNGLQIMRSWSSTDDCGNTSVFDRDDFCTVAAFQLSAKLNGALLSNGGGNLMRDDLRIKGLIPLTEPFTDLPGYQHRGKGGGEVLNAGLLDTTGANAIVDWVFVEVRDATDPSLVLSTRSALLQRDGDVVTAAGDATLFFSDLPEGPYFVALRHRNHLGLGTEKTWNLSSTNIPSIDFSNLTVDVSGKTAGGHIFDGKRAMWAGDLNGDRRVIYQGPLNDIFFLFSRVLSDSGNTSYLANYISSGYDLNDLNMDGNIIYQGPNNERAMVLYHTVLIHPENVLFLANFIVVEQLP